MSGSSDRHIASLELQVTALKAERDMLKRRRKSNEEVKERLYQRIRDLEANLVERDVYEAEGRLPPEQAALIRHLKVVERCIDDGPREYSYAESDNCSFCGAWDVCKRDCEWLALQFDRKPVETMTKIHTWALEENKRRPNPTFVRYRNDQTDAARYSILTAEQIRQANEVVERSRAETLSNVRVYTNPNVAPGRVYLIQNQMFAQPSAQAPSFESLENRVLNNMTPEERERIRNEGLMREIAFRLKVDEINGTNLFPRQTEYLGRFPDADEVAPSDDDDVP